MGQAFYNRRNGDVPPPGTVGVLDVIVDDSPVFIFLWRVAEGWPVEYVSRNVGRLGYTAEEFLEGMVSWPGITHPEDLPRLEREVAEHLRHGRDRFGCEYRLLARSGEIRWMRDWNAVIRNEAGAITHIQGLILDVTAERTSAAAAAELQRRLRHDVLAVTDRERTRIGMELMEGVAQTLAGVRLACEAVVQALRDRGLPEADHMRDVATYLGEAIVKTRGIAASMMPVDLRDDGLAAALDCLAADSAQNTGIRCRCDIQDAGLAIDHHVATELFEIGRAALAVALADGPPTDLTIRLEVCGAAGRLEIETSGARPREVAAGEPDAFDLLRYRAESVGGPLRIERRADGIRIECGFVNARQPPPSPGDS